MKKFSLIAGLAALATVGGVFAAWQFEGGTGARPETQNIGVGVDATIEVSGVPGDLALTGSFTNLMFTQDTGNKSAQLTATSGGLTLTYTEHATAKDLTLGGNSYTLKATVTYVDDTTMTSYFTSQPSSAEVVMGTIDKDNLSYTLTAADLDNLFAFKANSITTAAEAQTFIDTFDGEGAEKFTITFSLS